ncbi:coil containing protein [Vibrio phage 1.238.A._10N.261.52.F10]|uniref:Coil containing protein n=2 Tax=Pariacacavirus TaxID=2948856 RepID=A0A2I7RUF5_9CAUD|nr:coil containing protein [Vibrio phage 1.238.A._10N.261.52.F10]YP_010093470.1 coil containing protein [Vibrio phage 1.245.O._10N.261.54.C7]AUR97273.1 coil containing protein [Vibrio phage 1.238.A._10N.261.52.F10]AUR97367.1 coil containing protein [Vibrio phage 1.238.B._10N.261.52.F10]AUR97940.1 coil containing protein [Vibrio phage 1.245.O._10N.261.54.C7]
MGTFNRGIWVDMFKQNAMGIASAVIGVAVVYGALSAEVNAMKAEQDKRAVYISQFIQLRSDFRHIENEQERNRAVWGKLDGTLNALNTTLSIQGVEISQLKQDVEEIKEAVVR